MAIVEHIYFKNIEFNKRIVKVEERVILYKGWGKSIEGKVVIEWKEFKNLGNEQIEYRWLYLGKGRSNIFLGDEINFHLNTLITKPNKLGFHKKYTFEKNEQTGIFPLP